MQQHFSKFFRGEFFKIILQYSAVLKELSNLIKIIFISSNYWLKEIKWSKYFLYLIKYISTFNTNSKSSQRSIMSWTTTFSISVVWGTLGGIKDPLTWLKNSSMRNWSKCHWLNRNVMPRVDSCLWMHGIRSFLSIHLHIHWLFDFPAYEQICFHGNSPYNVVRPSLF